MKKIFSYLLTAFIFAAMSISAQTSIYTPELASPENEDTDQMPNVVLNWDAVTGGTGDITYECKIATDAAFTDPVTFITEFSGVQCEYLLFGTEYFWKVRATDGVDTSYWSETWSFITFDEVICYKPNNGSDDEMPDETIKWKNKIGGNIITGLTHFDVQTDTAETFDSPLSDIYSVESSLFLVSAEMLRFGTLYYWRVRARHDLDESEWSPEYFSFTTIFAVELEEPQNGTDDLGIDVYTQWDEISGIVNYIIQVDDDPAFGSPEIFYPDTNSVYVDMFTFGNTYNWRVCAAHINDTSDWSEVWTFETINEVLLTSPEDGMVNVIRLPVLEWEEILGITEYQLQYNTTPDFTDPIADELILAGSNEFQVVYILDEGQEYFWRARAIHSIDTSAWGVVWTFTVVSGAGINDDLFNQSNIKVYPNPSSGKIFLDINSNQSFNIKYSIIDLLGQVFVNDKINLNQGTNSEEILLNDLPNGIYILRLEKEGSFYNKKFVIDR